jgi:hypothetical protein
VIYQVQFIQDFLQRFLKIFPKTFLFNITAEDFPQDFPRFHDYRFDCRFYSAKIFPKIFKIFPKIFKIFLFSIIVEDFLQDFKITFEDLSADTSVLQRLKTFTVQHHS